MHLITEQIQDVSILVEEDSKTGEKKNYFIEGIFLQAEQKNRNGRVYPKRILEREVNRYVKEYMNEKRGFGELGHPENPTVNLPLVSHMIVSLKAEGNDYLGRAKIVGTPNGEIVKTLIDEGAKLGVSSRGVGSLQEKQGVNYVQDDYFLATPADIVADPSAPDAFVRGVMEDREWVYTTGGALIERKIDNWKNIITKTPKRNLDKAKISVFEDFLKSL